MYLIGASKISGFPNRWNMISWLFDVFAFVKFLEANKTAFESLDELKSPVRTVGKLISLIFLQISLMQLTFTSSLLWSK